MSPKTPNLGFHDFLDSLKSIHGLVGSVGILVPAAATFLSAYAPPPPLLTAPLTTALSVAALMGTYYHKSRTSRARGAKLPPLVRRALWVIGSSVVTVIVYTRVLNLLTVATVDGPRYQIGFYSASFGLTKEGRALKALYPDQTPYVWLMEDVLMHPEGIRKVWHWWAIDLSALVTFLLFSFAFVLWTHGWALLAKHRALDAAKDVQPDDLRASPPPRASPL